MVRLGQGAHLGIGVVTPFTTDGGAAAIDMRWNVDEGFDSMQLEREPIEFNDLLSEWSRADILKAGQRKVTGSITIKATYDGLQDILRMVTGHDATVGGSVAPFTYAFTPVARNLSSHYWLGTTDRAFVIEVFRGGTAGTDNSVYYQGCEIQEISFSFEPGALVEITMTIIGRGFTIGASSTATLKTDLIKATTGQDQSASPFVQLGGATFTARSATVTINLGIDERRDVTGIEPLLPAPSGKIAVTFETEIETADDTFLNRLNDPETTGTGRFSSAMLDIDNGVAGAGNRSLTFLFNELLLKSPAEPRVSGLGPVTTQLSTDALADNSTGVAYTATVVNGESAYST